MPDTQPAPWPQLCLGSRVPGPPSQGPEGPTLTQRLHLYTLPVPALCEVGLRRAAPLPLPPRNPPRAVRPRRNLPDTPKVSVFSFLSSAHVVRLELKDEVGSKCSGHQLKFLSQVSPSERPGIGRMGCSCGHHRGRGARKAWSWKLLTLLPFQTHFRSGLFLLVHWAA